MGYPLMAEVEVLPFVLSQSMYPVLCATDSKIANAFRHRFPLFPYFPYSSVHVHSHFCMSARLSLSMQVAQKYILFGCVGTILSVRCESLQCRTKPDTVPWAGTTYDP